METNYDVIKAKYSWTTEFFLYCSGVDRHWLGQCPQKEVNKYFCIGGTVFMTAFIAFITSSYAFFRVFGVSSETGLQVINAFTIGSSLTMGCIWSAFIFFIDRYIVATMNKSGSIWDQLGLLLPRLMLAVVVSVTLSQPVEVWFFRARIKEQLARNADAETKYALHELQQKIDGAKTVLAKANADLANFAATVGKVTIDQITNAQAQEESRQNYQEKKENDRGIMADLNAEIATLKARNLALKEDDADYKLNADKISADQGKIIDIGNSEDNFAGRVNSFVEAGKHIRNYNENQANLQRGIYEGIQQRAAESENEIKLFTAQEKLRSDSIGKLAFSENLFSQLEALDDLRHGREAATDAKTQESRASINDKYWGLVILFLIIEIAPCFTKFFSPKGEYDVLSGQYYNYFGGRMESMLQKERDVFNIYYTRGKEEDISVIEEFFKNIRKDRQGMIDRIIEKWKNDKSTYASLLDDLTRMAFEDIPGSTAQNFRYATADGSRATNTTGTTGQQAKTGEQPEEKVKPDGTTGVTSGGEVDTGKKPFWKDPTHTVKEAVIEKLPGFIAEKIIYFTFFLGIFGTLFVFSQVAPDIYGRAYNGAVKVMTQFHGPEPAHSSADSIKTATTDKHEHR